MPESPITAAIRFEAESYDLTGPSLMGRQAAGSGFLRAAVMATGDTPLVGYGPNKESGAAFAELVRRIDPAAATRWIRSDQLDDFNAIGVCYRPDHLLAPEAMLRLRVGPARHCLCGVTHTLSNSAATDSIARYVTAALTPWDALICTTRAARAVVESVLEEQSSYLAWRFGAAAVETPQLPVIPLGVHCADFAFSGDDRDRARQALGLGPDEVVALYAGRLAFADKAHPFAMYFALEAAAKRTRRPLTLILAGRFLSPFAEGVFRSGLERFCPSVRSIVVDGGAFDAYQDCWAAADLFVSLSDSIQETFGLTPIEAMAAGLPCVVSDWNGYRDTVRDGIDGFRIPSWAPAAPNGEPIARRYESGVIGNGRYSWRVTAGVSVDMAQLIERLCALIESPDLRRRMGEAGRARAQEVYDWPAVFAQYQALWGELNARRLSVQDNPELLAKVMSAPRAAPSHPDPFRMFAAYPTNRIVGDTRLRAVPGASLPGYREIIKSGLFPEIAFDEPMVAALFTALEAGEATASQAAALMRCPLASAVQIAASLAKMGLVRLA